MTGSTLNGKHIRKPNKNLLKHQFPKLQVLFNLLAAQRIIEKVTVGSYIDNSYHWLTAVEFSTDKPLKVYHSVNFTLTNKMKYVHLKHIYEFSEVGMVTMQKQNKICGLYAIAA